MRKRLLEERRAPEEYQQDDYEPDLKQARTLRAVIPKHETKRNLVSIDEKHRR